MVAQAEGNRTVYTRRDGTPYPETGLDHSLFADARTVMSGWGLRELGWVATMVVSELAANAALHARGADFSVRVSTEADGVRLELDDTSLRLPQQRLYSNEATTGRGLRLVSELAEDWGFQPTETGKTVWALLRATSPHEDDGDGDLDALLDAFADGADLRPQSDGRQPETCFYDLAAAA